MRGSIGPRASARFWGWGGLGATVWQKGNCGLSATCGRAVTVARPQHCARTVPVSYASGAWLGREKIKAHATMLPDFTFRIAIADRSMALRADPKGI